MYQNERPSGYGIVGIDTKVRAVEHGVHEGEAVGVMVAFKNGEDLYCATASTMFGVPVEKHGVNSELRQKGKIAVLACGYNGSVVRSKLWAL